MLAIVRPALNAAVRLGALLSKITSVVEMLDEPFVVTMDADDTHDPTPIPEMVRRLGAGTDLVVASRFAKGCREVGAPLHRRVIGPCFRVGRKSVFRRAQRSRPHLTIHGRKTPGPYLELVLRHSFQLVTFPGSGAWL